MENNEFVNKYYTGEIFIKDIFEKLGFIDITGKETNDNYLHYRPDFIFENAGKKYCIEVKRNFSNYFIQKGLIYFYDFIKIKKLIGILVILDKVPDQYKKIVKEKYNIDIYDISNILYLIYDNKSLQKELDKIISFSLDNILPKEINLKINKDDYMSKSKDNYIELLDEIKGGQKNSKKYENLLERIIKDIFSNELTLFKAQKRTEDGINIFDMICKIKTGVNDDFFSIVENYFNTKYILFEFKNYANFIKQVQICTTEKYLFGTALRKVAIIITRKGIDKNGKKLINGILRESGKLFIILNDDDVKTMIKLYENGEKATNVLTDKLDDLLTTLEK